MYEMRKTSELSSVSTFGDEDQMYELLESKESEDSLKHDFEFRVLNDPNKTFFETYVTSGSSMTLETIHARAIEQLQEKAAATDMSNTWITEDEMRHIRTSLVDAAAEAGRKVEVSEDGLDLLPASIKNHIMEGGSVYETEAENGKSFLSTSPTGLGCVSAYLDSDYVSEPELDDDFTKAVESINVQGNSMEQ